MNDTNNRSYVTSDLDVSVGEELRSTVAQILDGELEYKDEAQEWLQSGGRFAAAPYSTVPTLRGIERLVRNGAPRV